MNLPNLARIVDTYIPIKHGELNGYLNQLRHEVVPSLRKLQSDHLLRWFSFLIHRSDMLDGREFPSATLYIHLRLEPEPGLSTDEFIAKLPPNFCKPMHKPLREIGGIEPSVLRNEDWARAWKIHGEASEWVVFLLESHGDSAIPVQQLIQFLHFVTNPLALGHRCTCSIPGGPFTF